MASIWAKAQCPTRVQPARFSGHHPRSAAGAKCGIRAPLSFVGRLVVLNLSGVTLNVAGIAHLISELSKRNISVMGLEGVEPIQSPGLPPVLRGRRAVSNIETIESARGDAQLARSQAQEHRNEPNGTELTPLVGRTVADVERELILETLTHCGGNRTHAANVLGISLRTIRNKLNDYAGAQRPSEVSCWAIG